jgi:hypothetical protein
MNRDREKDDEKREIKFKDENEIRERTHTEFL